MRGGWAVKRIGAVAETRLGKTLPQGSGRVDGGQRYLRNVNVRWGQITTVDLNTMDFSEHEQRELELRAGDVLVCEGGEVGRCALVAEDMPDVYFQNALHRLRSNGTVVPAFLAYAIENLVSSGGLEGVTSQVTIAHLNQAKLRAIELLVPTLAEQRRIVDLIGSLDEAIEAAEESESRSLSAYRAVAGVLKGPMTPLSAILEKIEAGKSPSGEERQPLADERAVLKVSAIGANGFDADEVKTVAPNVELSSLTRVTSGDLLMVRANGVLSRVGAVCLVPAVGDRYYLSDKTLRLISNPNLVAPNWLLAALRAPGVRHQIAQLTGGSDMRNITQKAILELRIPCPNLDIQTPTSELLQALVGTATAGRDHGLALRHLRTNLLTALLSGTHEIPESYDDLLPEAA